MISCVFETNQYSWLVEDGDGPFYGKACGQYTPYMQTALHCFVKYSGEGSTQDKLERYTNYCSRFAGSELGSQDYLMAWENATRYLQDGRLIAPGQPLSSPIVMPDEVVRGTLNYFHYIYYNFSAAFSFSVWINSAVAVAILVAVFANRSRANDKVTRFLRSKILVPAVFGTSHHSETRALPFYKVILPTRGEAVAMAVFIALNLVLAIFNYPLIKTKFDSKAIFLAKCVANRTGGLAFGLIPVTILLAGRNNIVQRLTGLPYSSMIFFHKWCSRTMTMYALVHAGAWMLYGIFGEPESVWSMFRTYAYWRWGTAALLASVVLIVHSIHSIKARWYEIFVVIHIAMALLFLWACLKHCSDLGWLGWIYLSLGLWGSERAARLWRLLIGFGGYQSGYAQLVSHEDHVYKIVVPHTRSRRFRFFPGCYAFLYIQAQPWLWQSHPFSLMTTDEGYEILVKAKDGLTRQLFDTLPHDVEARVPLRLALEGPYGHEAPLQRYQDVLVLASGAGIPGPISYLQKLVQDPASIRRFTFVWVVPTERLLSAMRDQLLRAAQLAAHADPKTLFEFQVYVTRPQLAAAANSRPAWIPPQIQLVHGRPDVRLLLTHFCKHASGDIAIASCANPTLDDLLRRYVSELIAYSDHRLDFYDELQVW